jgi:hypothetical protein
MLDSGAAWPTYRNGIKVGSATHTMIGGASAAEGNIIAEVVDGMRVHGEFNFILGNRMTLGFDDQPAASGVSIDGEHNWVQGNVIGETLSTGAQVDTGGWNTIRRNLISGCSFNPIDLANGGNGGVKAPAISRLRRTA